MKKKIEIFIEEGTLKLIEQRAADEGRSLSEIIQDALFSYLRKSIPKSFELRKAYQAFCEQPIILSSAQFCEILKQDTWINGYL
jgi:hypothetical protein